VQFLVLTRRRMDVFPAEAWNPELLETEAQRVRELFSAGIVRDAWRRKDTPGAALLLEAATEVEVRAAVASLPLAQLEMLEVSTLAELDPYPGFGPR
jgi:muconolactone delta-isomerase